MLLTTQTYLKSDIINSNSDIILKSNIYVRIDLCVSFPNFIIMIILEK